MSRRIPKNYRHITGLVSDGEGGAYAFEGPLEIDFYTLMGHQRAVREIQTQNVTIEHRGANGRWTRYTPEALIRFEPHLRLRPLLVEVKPTATLIDDWNDDIELKVRAGIRHACENGWTFKVYTEREIRTPYLENIKTLRIHRSHDFADEELLPAQARVETSPGISFGSLLHFLEPKRLGEPRLNALSKIYYLLGRGRIEANLFNPLGYATPMLPNGSWHEHPWDKRWLRSAMPPRPIHRKGW